MVPNRTFLGVAVAAVVLGACSASNSKGSTASTLVNGKAFDSSAFCVKARQVGELDRATQSVDVTDVEAAKKAYDALFAAASAVSAQAPSELKTDYVAYVKWLGEFQAALRRHDYKLADALGDETFSTFSDSEAVKASNAKVTDYLETKCGVGVPTTTIVVNTTVKQ
jgi:hypothetical protein